MAGLLSSDEISCFTGQLYEHFLTFTFNQNVVVNKEPLVTYTSPGNVYPGYENNDITDNATYTPVSGVYPAITYYQNDFKQDKFNEPNIYLADGEIAIEVLSNTKNYIQNGKTENIVVDGFVFDLVSEPWCQNYFGLEFWYYKLKRKT